MPRLEASTVWCFLSSFGAFLMFIKILRGGSGDTGLLLWPFTLPIAVESKYSLLRLP